jgi:hypothetical protein
MRPRLRLSLLGLILAAVAAAAFMSYLRPNFVVSVANQLWLCF